MRFLGVIAVLGLGLASAVSTAFAGGRSEVVTLLSGGQEVVGTMTRPDGVPAPVVLLLHGFTGTRDELASEHIPSGVFAYTADKLAAAGYASLRIDFRGSGESVADLSFVDTTFEGQIQDGLAALDYLATLEDVDSSRMFIIGWSQGGLVASAVAGRTGTPRAVALWNAVGTPMQTFTGLLGEEAVNAAIDADAQAVLPFTLPWGAEIGLKGAFFDQVASFDPMAEIAAYKGPLMVAQGDKDTAVLPENGPKFIAAHDGPEQLWTADMDHVFNIFAEAVTLEALVDATVGFFEESGS